MGREGHLDDGDADGSRGEAHAKLSSWFLAARTFFAFMALLFFSEETIGVFNESAMNKSQLYLTLDLLHHESENAVEPLLKLFEGKVPLVTYSESMDD